MAEPNGNGLSRYGALATIIGTAFLLLVALFTLWSTANTAATEAHDLKDEVRALEGHAAADRLEINTLQAKMIEVETQFRAADQVRNLMHANDLRMTAMLWKKAYGQDYPIGNSYYPTISQSGPQEAR